MCTVHIYHTILAYTSIYTTTDGATSSVGTRQFCFVVSRCCDTGVEVGRVRVEYLTLPYEGAREIDALECYTVWLVIQHNQLVLCWVLYHIISYTGRIPGVLIYNEQ